MQNERFRILAAKFINGSASPAEIQELHDAYELWEDDEEIIVTNKLESEIIVGERIFATIKRRIQKNVVPVVHNDRYSKVFFLKLAAAVIICCMAGGLFYKLLYKQPAAIENTLYTVEKRYKNDVVPGKNTATLQLGDGSVVSLIGDSAQAFGQQGESDINTDGSGALIYSKASTRADVQVVYNTVTT